MQLLQAHRLIFPAILAVALLAILIPAIVLAQDAPAPENLPPNLVGVEPGDPAPPLEPKWKTLLTPEELEDLGVEGQAGPEPPSGLAFTETTCTSITMQWDDVFLAQSYRLDYKEASSETWLFGGTVATSPTSNPSIKVSNLTRNTSYHFRAIAWLGGYGDPSPTVTVSTAVTVTITGEGTGSSSSQSTAESQARAAAIADYNAKVAAHEGDVVPPIPTPSLSSSATSSQSVSSGTTSRSAQGQGSSEDIQAAIDAARSNSVSAFNQAARAVLGFVRTSNVNTVLAAALEPKYETAPRSTVTNGSGTGVTQDAAAADARFNAVHAFTLLANSGQLGIVHAIGSQSFGPVSYVTGPGDQITASVSVTTNWTERVSTTWTATATTSGTVHWQITTTTWNATATASAQVRFNCPDDPDPTPTPDPDPTPTNDVPEFDDGDSITLSVDENVSGDFGSVLLVTDDDEDQTLGYTLSGAAAEVSPFSSVAVDNRASDGGRGVQLSIDPTEGLDHEAKDSYSFQVTASDGVGGNDAITVTVNINNLPEPPLRMDAPTVTAVSGSTTQLKVAWEPKDNTGRPDITSYDLRYWTGSATVPEDEEDILTESNIRAKTKTLTGLDAGTTYYVQVKAKNSEGVSPWSSTGSGSTNTSTDPDPTPQPDNPVITVARHSSMPAPPDGSLTEGGEVWFVVSSDKSPDAPLMVTIRISEPSTSGYLPSRVPPVATIQPNTRSVDVKFASQKDNDNEPNGSIHIRIGTGNGYTVGTPGTAFVLMDDDDGPSVPPDLGAVGLTDDIISPSPIWWRSVKDAASYNLRYAVETCPISETIKGAPLENNQPRCTTGTWQTISDIQSDGTVGSGASDASTDPPVTSQWVSIPLSTISPSNYQLYRLRVQAVDSDGDTSAWSGPAFVYATDGPPKRPSVFVPWPQIATYPVISWTGGYGNENRHRYLYVVCESVTVIGENGSPTTQTIQSRYGVSVSDITAGLNTWMHLLKRRPDARMYDFIRVTPVSDNQCRDVKRPADNPEYPEVRFVNEDQWKRARCHSDASSCYRSRTLVKLEAILHPKVVGAIPEPDADLYSGRLMMRDERRDGLAWNATITDGTTSCKVVYHAAAHEMGHALGVGLGQEEMHSNLGHPYLESDSLMSNPEPNEDLHCRPQPYDVVVITANMQDRFDLLERITRGES